MTSDVKQDKYNERLQRARSGNKMNTVKSAYPTTESNELADTSSVFGDVESGGVILDDKHLKNEDILIGLDTNDANALDVRYIDRRGPCNRFERSICTLGKKFGVKVVFEG